MISIGLYGKLPTHGDFIHRNLPSGFIAGWDQWLQHYIAGAREKIGADWLDIYLTSPIWRFVFSDGVVDESRWAGILMPSVDQVGRYYPFSVAVRLPDYVNPFEFLAVQSAWYEGLEDIALKALDGEFTLDELLDEVAALDLNLAAEYELSGVMSEPDALQIDFEFEEQSAATAYPYFLNVMMAQLMKSYSVWSTLGSDRVSPCLFSVKNLPSVSRLPAMLDGNWTHWGWQQPYKLGLTDR
ncbi:MAG: type VI secretion system-associated protein TagF [Gammaproteobacteria bacterium]|nr:type VI secretion system-associated protein TagF [Gammaproteobacteria bacterium]